MFQLIQQSTRSAARRGQLTTAHGVIESPFFMTVGTQGVVKHITTDELRQLEAPVLLANTYHLLLRPGSGALRERGGLHQFMNWSGPILTDSGGFQAFSLAQQRDGQPNLVKVTDQGIHFRSPWDGSRQYLTPELSLDLQVAAGVDLAVCLDQCLALPATEQAIKQSVERTSVWAYQTMDYYQTLPQPRPLLLAVIQGGLSLEWRQRSLDDLVALDFAGYNIGGLSVGETAEEMYQVLEWLTPNLPANKSRYLMGVGYPDNLVASVQRGVDMFDCVIPTREGRHGRVFIWQDNRQLVNQQGQVRDFYRTENIKNQKFASLDQPINPNSKLASLREYSWSYLHYLHKINEALASRLASLYNLEFYYELMAAIRQAISDGQL